MKKKIYKSPTTTITFNDTIFRNFSKGQKQGDDIFSHTLNQHCNVPPNKFNSRQKDVKKNKY